MKWEKTTGDQLRRPKVRSREEGFFFLLLLRLNVDITTSSFHLVNMGGNKLK